MWSLTCTGARLAVVVVVVVGVVDGGNGGGGCSRHAVATLVAVADGVFEWNVTNRRRSHRVANAQPW